MTSILTEQSVKVHTFTFPLVPNFSGDTQVLVEANFVCLIIVFLPKRQAPAGPYPPEIQFGGRTLPLQKNKTDFCTSVSGTGTSFPLQIISKVPHASHGGATSDLLIAKFTSCSSVCFSTSPFFTIQETQEESDPNYVFMCQHFIPNSMLQFSSSFDEDDGLPEVRILCPVSKKYRLVEE